MKELIIKLQPFVLKQTVFIKDGRKTTEVKVPSTEVAKFIASCDNLEAVHLFGSEKLARKIKTDCLTKYQMNNMKTRFMFNK